MKTNTLHRALRVGCVKGNLMQELERSFFNSHSGTVLVVQDTAVSFCQVNNLVCRRNSLDARFLHSMF